MKLRTIALSAGALLVGLPLVVFVITVAWISVLDRFNGTIRSSGDTREYLLYVPDSYEVHEPTPLVISLHAGATWPAHQQNLSRWNRLADEHGFIVVYPSGTPMLFGIVRIWHTFELGAGLERDVTFIAELIDTLQSAYNIDPTRIYANGMSNGGGMAFVLSCTLSARIAAIGVVAAAQSLPSDWCPAERPIPLMAFHGNADRIVPYDGGPLGDPFNPVKPVFPAVRDWVAGWAKRNRCLDTPVDSAIAPDVVRRKYLDCGADANVVLHVLLGGGHSWPGGKPPPEWRVGATNMNIDATRAMWAFFREHPLHRP